ncbi:cytochrome c maturation protein CcmE [Niveibacterium sp. SC-1]|uniref:cytochrome c maturation protein CcmE n=1 Tax=Niveibacterium sp. SC-1 TaxID=3135646 RepID=UPI00311DF78A
MKPRHRRLALILGGLCVLGIGAALVLQALNSSIAFFVTPTEIASGKAPKDTNFRLGGLVKTGSLHREGLTAHFVVTDTAREITVRYTGILPDLFKEGRGVVAQGRIGADGGFEAAEVLAKHDENYMPPEAKHAVDQAHKELGMVQK